MFTGNTGDNIKEIKEETNKETNIETNKETNLTRTKSKNSDLRAMTFAAQANSPQGGMNTALPLTVGGMGANLSLINFSLFSIQVNISNGGDSQSISVNGISQNQSNEG